MDAIITDNIRVRAYHVDKFACDVFIILHLADSLADELLLVTYLIGGVRFGPFRAVD